MQKIILKRCALPLLLLMGFLVLFFGVSISFVTAGKDSKPFISAEVDIATLSPNGPKGGLAIPASTYSYGQSSYYGYTQASYYNYGQASYYTYGQSSYFSYTQAAYFPPPVANIDDSIDTTQQGIEFTVFWSSTGATSCVINQREGPSGGPYSPWAPFASGISGSQPTSPIFIGDHQYAITYIGLGGSTFRSITHFVITRQPDLNITPDEVNEGGPISISWICWYSGPAYGGIFPYSAGVLFSTGGVESDVIDKNAPDVPGDYDYELSCDNGGWTQRTVTVREPTIDINATKTLIQPGETSNVFWSAFGVDSCTVVGTDGFFDSVPPTPPNLVAGDTWDDNNDTGPLDEQTVYTLTCETAVPNTYIKEVIININPEFEEF